VVWYIALTFFKSEYMSRIRVAHLFTSRSSTSLWFQRHGYFFPALARSSAAIALTSASLMANFDVRFSMIMSWLQWSHLWLYYLQLGFRWSHLWLYYRQLGFRWSHLWLYYLQLDLTSSLSSFLEGIVTTVRVRKVFSLCRQILKDIIMANQ
jgi:hypothetical protein